MTRRPQCIRWDDYFMGTAILAGKRQKDSNSMLQIGSCIVSPDGKIVVGVGHHTVIDGFDSSCPDYWCHAISNAMVWANRHNLNDCILYTVTYPCNKCAQLIIQSRMSHVHYMNKWQCDGSETTYSQKLLSEAGISCREYLPMKDIEIDFRRMDPALFDGSSALSKL
ncbi:PREDICTED: deoxycytidylate deaminase-like [Amphimedon queenslandica]|uniref:dCMP deaminase n=1 Tax=Amphimedon queenslandica TaxID=400682 RepID=A0A1X7V951_AMPQE|nr:PREDICTED: deoxycytidylate deaminase-like [Amphimedon queenslandica]XP_019860026.1 PREDICTED: deoxycytidylate deaminase-like [Amphimedon queenslandica]|eukprot:XP_019850334.1 PREDICTED: deoxycytidylate deaminase-like [Amphimedon queenslandica]